MIDLKYKEKFYPLPASITYSNMFLGLLAIFASMAGDYHSLKYGGLLILAASLSDKLDGYMARKLNMTSDLGRELDSLCDLVSFGLAPMLLAWNMGMAGLGWNFILAASFYIGAGIFRLARYNVGDGGDYIAGLPITLAGGVLALKYLLDLGYRPGSVLALRENLLLIIILGLLMVLDFKLKKPNIIDKDLF